MTRLSAPDSQTTKEACENAFMVVLHDFAPPFSEQLCEICSQLKPLVGSNFSAGFVPCWHGGNAASGDTLAPLLLGCKEVVIHGLSHQRIAGGGILSWVCNRSDEFRGLPAAVVTERLQQARKLTVEQLGEAKVKHVVGVLPPAYQFPETKTFFCDQRNDDYLYVLRFSRIDFRGGMSVPINTWSYDWGRFSSAGWAGKVSADSQSLIRLAIPCLAIHPIDLQRGWFRDAIRLIRKWLSEGRQPVTPSDLLLKSHQSSELLLPEGCSPAE